MTRAEALAIHPHSRSTYALAILLCAFFAAIPVFIHPRHPSIDAWAMPILLFFLALATVHAASRILLPVSSAKLTLRLARYDRPALWGFCTLLVGALLIAGGIRGLHSDLRLLSNTSILLPWLIADLLGTTPYKQPKSFSTEPPTPWRESLKPIQSTHWGQR